MLGVVVSVFAVYETSAKAAGDVDPLQDWGLTELAHRLRPEFLIGTHSKPEQFRGGEATHVILKNYNMVSVGIYQRSTQRKARNNWNFTKVTPIVEFANQHNIQVYAHPMFGSNGYLPDWLLQGEFTDEQLLDIIEDRIKTILTRYRGRIHILDVYNEGLSRSRREWREEDNLFIRLGYHENEIGKWPVFLEKILVWCRQYGGDDLKLIYNDNHNTLLGMPQSKECIQLYRALKQAGLSIDGIGIQCHTKINDQGVHELSANQRTKGPVFDAGLFAQNLRAMGDAGIDAYITECDVHLYGEIDEEKLQLQADAYRSILKACIEAPACKAFKTWGFTDASCWKPMTKGNRSLKYEPCPLVFDHDLKPKPAYHAMQSLLIELIQKKNEQ